MNEKWTIEQVSGMATDAASITAGRKLGVAKKWQVLGQFNHLLWGEIKGSGKNPYQACIDIRTPVFKCSCPSRKFPCKHSLGLAYVYAESPSLFSDIQLPEWVETWQQRREHRQAQQTTQKNQPLDAATQQRRAAAQQKRTIKRQDNMNAGLEELQRWLEDTIRHGLARALEQTQSWEHMITRLTDAQAPGLANRLQRCLDLRYETAQWQAAMLAALAQLQLLVTASLHKATLPKVVQDDIDDLLGLTVTKEKLLTQSGHHDNWQVMAKWTSTEGKIKTQRTWLRGETRQQWALLLDFSVANQVLPMMPVEGSRIEGELVFYPGSWPVRALIKQQTSTQPINASLLKRCCVPIKDVYQHYATVLSDYPWLDRLPVGLSQVMPVAVDQTWRLIDNANDQIPLTPRLQLLWELLAVSGGHPIDIIGEWNGMTFFPMTVIVEKRVLSLFDLAMDVA